MVPVWLLVSLWLALNGVAALGLLIVGLDHRWRSAGRSGAPGVGSPRPALRPHHRRGVRT